MYLESWSCCQDGALCCPDTTPATPVILAVLIARFGRSTSPAAGGRRVLLELLLDQSQPAAHDGLGSQGRESSRIIDRLKQAAVGAAVVDCDFSPPGHFMLQSDVQ